VRGFTRIAIVEPSVARRRALEELGFVALPSEGAMSSVPAALADTSPGTVVDCTGHPSGLALAVDLLPPAGTTVVVGMPPEPSSIDLTSVAMKEIVIRGSLAYSSENFGEALIHIAEGRVPSDEIVTTVAPLQRLSDGLTT
jgi:threonine dehydrogenase-like Zn-dependent dehydrogenase